MLLNFFTMFTIMTLHSVSTRTWAGQIAVHQVPVAVHDVTFLDVDWQVAVGAAADGQCGVVEGDADGLQGDGVDAVGWCGGKMGDSVSLVSKGKAISF
jgi:hypothetical protein